MDSRLRILVVVAAVSLAGTIADRVHAQSLSCTILVKARWTVAPGQIGYIGLKSAVDEKNSVFRVENGNWQLIDDHSFGRVVTFHPDGRWDDSYRRCQYCRERSIVGRGDWHMREEIQPGCGYRRQYSFYLFVRDAQTTRLVAEKRIYVPGVDRFTRRGKQLIDLGDLSVFF